MKGFETSREATTKIILIRTVSYVSSTISTTFMTKHRIHVGWSQSPSKCFFRLRGRISNLKSCSHICTHASRFHQNTLSIIWNCLSSQPIMYIKSTPLVACLQRLPHVEDLNKSSSNISRFSLYHVIAVHLMHRLQRRASCEASHQFPPELRHFPKWMTVTGCGLWVSSSQNVEESKLPEISVWLSALDAFPNMLNMPTSSYLNRSARDGSWKFLVPCSKDVTDASILWSLCRRSSEFRSPNCDIRVNLHVVRKCMSRIVKAFLSRFCFPPLHTFLQTLTHRIIIGYPLRVHPRIQRVQYQLCCLKSLF